jgi:hypothetical protein
MPDGVQRRLGVVAGVDLLHHPRPVGADGIEAQAIKGVSTEWHLLKATQGKNFVIPASPLSAIHGLHGICASCTSSWYPESACRPMLFKPWIPAFAGMTT